MKRINIKIVLSIIVYFFSVIIYNYYSYHKYEKKEIEIIDDKLKIGAYAVYDFLGKEFFTKAVNKEYLSLEDDWKNILLLTSYSNHANLTFIYSTIKKDDELYLTSSSASKEELENKTELHYFYHYDSAGEALKKAFISNKIEVEIYSDNWGTFRALHIPIKLENHTVVVSAEISLEKMNNKLNEIKYDYLFEAILYLIFTLPIILAIYLILKEHSLRGIEIKSKIRLERMSAMVEMINLIAHQWRQPLNVISTGISGLKLQKELNMLTDDIVLNTYNFIEDNVQYLSKTIDDFRDFINIDRKKVKFNLNENIEQFLQQIEKTSKEEGINIIKDIDSSIDVIGFPNDLIKCFINIYTNSKDILSKLEKDKYFIISANLFNNELIISLTDNGGGISDEIIAKIFEPYFTTKHQYIGTGLNLHITYTLIVKIMNGDIKAENSIFILNGKKMKGAKFTIKIPIS